MLVRRHQKAIDWSIQLLAALEHNDSMPMFCSYTRVSRCFERWMVIFNHLFTGINSRVFWDLHRFDWMAWFWADAGHEQRYGRSVGEEIKSQSFGGWLILNFLVCFYWELYNIKAIKRQIPFLFLWRISYITSIPYNYHNYSKNCPKRE